MARFIKILLLTFIACFAFEGLKAQSVGGSTSGSAIYCANDNAGFITLVGHNGTIISWEYSTDSINWFPTGSAIVTSFSYDSLLQSTYFRAIVQDGSFPPDTSTVSLISIYPPSNGGVITGAGISCIITGSGTGTLTINGNVGNVLYWESSTDDGATWDSIPGTTTTLPHPNIIETTWYRAVVQNGSTCPNDTSDTAYFYFDSVSVAGILSGTDTICPAVNSGSIALSGQVGSILSWQSSNDGSAWTLIADTTPSQTYTGLLQTTMYQVIVQNGTCPADTSDSAILTIIPNVVSAGSDTTIALGLSVELNGSGNGTAVWSPATGLDSVNAFTPNANPTTTTTYTLTVTDNNSCVSTDSVLVTIYTLEFDGMVSNLFTPNGDGINDTWYIEDIQNFEENEVLVYNIYGNLVYNKKGYTNDWDGTYNGAALPDGTYYFVLRFEDSELILKGALDILKNK